MNGTAALIVADTAKNIGITGKGLIDGQGTLVTGHYNTQAAQGNLAAGKNTVPALIYMNGCTGVTVEGILPNSAEDVAIFNNCTDVTVTGITVDSKLNPATAGVVLEGCTNVKLNPIVHRRTRRCIADQRRRVERRFGNQQHHPQRQKISPRK